MRLDEHAQKVMRAYDLADADFSIRPLDYRSAAYDELRAERDALQQELLNTQWQLMEALNDLLAERSKHQPEPPKKAVYEWRGGEFSWTLWRNGVEVGGACPARAKGWHYSALDSSTTESIEGRATTESFARAAVEAVVRAHFGDEA